MIKGIGVLIKLRLKDRTPPCVLSFKTGGKTQTFRAYYSTDLREPNEYSNHGYESNPKKIVIAGQRAPAGQLGNIFVKEWLYINLQSEMENGSQVSVFASFKRD